MKNLTNPVPKLTLGAALLGLAVALSPPARAVDLLERYPSYLTKGLLGAANARAWSVTADDLFQVSRFRLVVGDQLKIETGPATLGIGHCSVGATVAILIPAEGGKLTRQGSAAPEEIAHIWLRFHPKEINRLFPPSTVSAGASDLLGQMRRIVAGKFMSSYHAGNQVMIPEPKDMTVDVDTQAGPREYRGRSIHRGELARSFTISCPCRHGYPLWLFDAEDSVPVSDRDELPAQVHHVIRNCGED